MAQSEIICPSDILSRDLFVYDNIDDAVEELRDIAINLNRTKLYYAWLLGKFLSDRKLNTHYGVDMEAMAEKLETTKNTLYRYRTVYRMLTEAQVKQLGSMGVSVNLVLELATIERGGHKEEAAQLMDLVLTGQVQEVKELQSQFSSIVAQQARPYNLLPGAEPPEAEGSSVKTLEQDADEIEESSKTPGQKIIDAEVVEDDDEDTSDDDGTEPSARDASQNKKGAKAMLRQSRQSIVAMRRDLSNLADHRAMLDVLEQNHAVIMGDPDSDQAFADDMSALFFQMKESVKTLIEQLIRGVNSGYITEKIPMPQCGKDAFDGTGLFS